MTRNPCATASFRITLLAAALAGCAATAPPGEVWKPAPVGMSWSTLQRNTGSFGKDVQVTVTRLPDRDWNGTPAVVLKTGNGMLLQQPADGRWLATLAPDGRTVATFDPPAGWSQPIAVGQSWKRPQKMTNAATGRTLEYEWGCTVAAFEKVTVPAGTFDAYRVECKSTIDAQDTFWVSVAVHPFLKTGAMRGPAHPSGQGTQETELLKLPSAG
ncbi:MAG: hypothetical protein U1F56_03000 [Rubrivivax sp.]